MLKIVLPIFMALLFFGCGSDSNTNSSDNTADKTHLSILRASTSSDIVGISQQIVLEFSAELNQSTVNTGTIYISRDNGEGGYDYVNCALKTEGAKVVITPYQYFHQNSSFVLSVTKAVKDISQKTLSDVYTYSFVTTTEEYDSTPLKIIAVKPPAKSPDNLAQTDIVLNFNKNLSSAPEHTGVETLRVINEANASQISGKLSVFNSLLRFEPDKPLPNDANISVSLVSSVADTYGYQNYSNYKWWFKTKLQSQNPVTNQGFASFGSYNMNAAGVVVRKIADETNSSSVVAATNKGLEFFNVGYAPYPAKPQLTHTDSYQFLHIQSMMVVDAKFLIVGTQNKGLYSLRIDGGEVSQVSKVDSNQTIYALNYGYDYQNGRVDKIYAVGPQYGLKIFDYNNTTGTLSLSKSVDANNTVYLDVLQAKEYNSAAGSDIKRVYVADYKGAVDVFDENGSKLKRVDVNGSVKKLALNQGSYGSLNGVFAVSSSGIVDQFDLNASRSTNNVANLLSDVSDVSSFVYTPETQDNYSALFYSEPRKGVCVMVDASIVGFIKSDKTIISLDTLKGYSSKSFLITLSQDGELNLYNGRKDTDNPIAYLSNPYNGATNADANTTVKIEFSDSYLDTNSISKGSFSIKDANTSNSIDFDLSMGYNTYSYMEYTLKPKSLLTSQHKYTVTVEGNVSDMIGNKLHDGNFSTFSFTVN